MTELFLHVLNMSITASILAVLVLVLRLILKKAPKWVSVLLWGLVAIRLVCPFGMESSLSLMPKTDWIPESYHQVEPAVSFPNCRRMFGRRCSTRRHATVYTHTIMRLFPERLPTEPRLPECFRFSGSGGSA